MLSLAAIAVEASRYKVVDLIRSALNDRVDVIDLKDSRLGRVRPAVNAGKPVSFENVET